MLTYALPLTHRGTDEQLKGHIKVVKKYGLMGICVPQAQATLASRELRGTNTEVTCRLEYKNYGWTISPSEAEISPLELRRRTKTRELVEATKRVLKAS